MKFLDNLESDFQLPLCVRAQALHTLMHAYAYMWVLYVSDTQATHRSIGSPAQTGKYIFVLICSYVWWSLKDGDFL